MNTAMVPTTTSPKLLVVDDDPAILSQLDLAFSREYQVFTADHPKKAWEIIEHERPELVTLDLALEKNDPESGFSLLEKCVEHDPQMKVILITGNDTQETALRAIDHGAYDFFKKPVDLSELGVLLRRALHVGRLARQNATQIPGRAGERRLGLLLGQSAQMRAVFHLIKKVAPTDVAVLILGESGTGKELVARELRRLSRRATRPFVSINCGAIPENLLESELFGHEKGSFTGAHTSRPGKLELAHTGIVFLDEIGEMPLALQSKLLRFLQEHEIERVGGRTVIRLDVQVVAATNRDLEAAIKEGRFREDLYYRLSVVNIHLPPLRERPEDILFLAQHFLHRFSTELRRGNIAFSRRAKSALQCHNWPGNVRELEHHLQRAVLLTNGHLIRARDLGLSDEVRLESLSLRKIRERSDRDTIVEALWRTSGNISRAAIQLEISRPSLHDLLKKHAIDVNDFKGIGEPVLGEVSD